MNSHGSRRPGGRSATHSSEQLLELRVQRDVTVGAELAERDVQPVRRADLHHRIDLQVQELAAAHPSPGEKLDREPGERVIASASRAQQLRGGAVIDEPRQRIIEARHVTGEHQHPRRRVLALPLAQPLEAHTQRAQPRRERALARPLAARVRLGGEMPLVALDMRATEIGNATDVRRLAGQPQSELAQHPLDVMHRGRPQRQAHLFDVALQRRREPGWDGRPVAGALRRLVRHPLAQRAGDDATVIERRLSPVEPGRERHDPAGMVRASPQRRVDQLLTSRIELRPVELARRHACDRCGLRHRPPLQLRRLR
jgi:hypothetical protein